MIYQPERIYVLKKYAEHQVTGNVLKAYPGAKVEYVDKQDIRFEGGIGEMVELGKKTIVLGEAQVFISPSKGQKIHYCPGPRKILPITGCPFNCEYCFLQGTYRGVHPRIKFNLNIDKLIKHLDKDIPRRSTGNRIQVYHMGENQDSLAFDYIFPLTKTLVPYFAEKNARLMLLTKSDNVNNLLELEHNQHTIVSWSINSSFATRAIEHDSATLEDRISAAEKVQEAGYPIRFRFDPLLRIPGRNWKKDYGGMMNKVFKNVKPERVTLGSLRFHPVIRTISEQRFKNSGLFENNGIADELNSDHRYRYEEKKRLEMYKFIVDGIKARSPETEIAFCKETEEVWKACGLNFQRYPPKCHCYL